MKTYNHKTLIRSAIRRIWLWSPMRRDAIRAARVSPGVVQCHICKTKVKENVSPKLFDVDHVMPASEPAAAITSWDDWIERMFCSAFGLRILCKPCHKAKTAYENARRKSRTKKSVKKTGSKKRS